MKKWYESVRDFYRHHRLFSLFFITMLVLNFAVIGLVTREATTFFTCSSYDRGPLGIYAMYSYLADKKVQVTRLKVAPYKELHSGPDSGRTLMIVSPQIQPGPWEWKYLLEWIKKGNRLITAGVFMPSHFFSGDFQVRAWQKRVEPCSLRVALPIDSVFPYECNLPPLPNLSDMLFLGSREKKEEGRFSVAVLSPLKPGMLPLLTSDTIPVAAKQIIGSGEWIMFAHFNPFANQIVKNERWFNFACRLLIGDRRFGSAKILFDEYHNGYSATENLWALLRYYQFDTSIIIGSFLVLAFLFFTGLRVMQPRNRPDAPSRDVIPGMKSMAGLFLRYNFFGGLIHREIRILRKHLLGISFEYTAKAPELAERYCAHRPLPPWIKNQEELVQLLRSAGRPYAPFTEKKLVTLFNTLLFMRKELAL